LCVYAAASQAMTPGMLAKQLFTAPNDDKERVYEYEVPPSHC
jgi:hypothetical protein